MARKLTKWWLGPKMGPTQRAEYLLGRYKALIEHSIYTYSRRYPGEVDWEPIVWDAAYRTAFRLDGGEAGFIPLFKTILWRLTANYVARHGRRRAKLMRQPMTDLDSIAW